MRRPVLALGKGVPPRVLTALRWAGRDGLNPLEDPRGSRSAGITPAPPGAQPFPPAQAQRTRARPRCPPCRWQRRRPWQPGPRGRSAFPLMAAGGQKRRTKDRGQRRSRPRGGCGVGGQGLGEHGERGARRGARAAQVAGTPTGGGRRSRPE